MKKICSKCEKEYEATTVFFQRNSSSKDGLRPDCKTCRSLQFDKNKMNKYYLNNKDKWKKYYKENKDKIKSKYIKKNKSAPEETEKEKTIQKQKRKEYNKKSYQKNKIKWLEKQKQYRLNNKEKIQKRTNIYKNKKRHSNPSYKILDSLRRRLNEYLKINKTSKLNKTIKLLGCNILQFKNHLESKFYNNQETNEVMSWNNYGVYGWHIDHIIPCSFFDLKCPLQQMVCFHYTNLQPLWAKDNLKKGNKII